MQKEIYLLGGGSSLSNYDLDWFKDKDTIGVNMTACYIEKLNYFITVDQSFFKKLTPEETRKFKENVSKKIFIVSFGTGVLYRNENGIVVDKRFNLHYDLKKFDEIIDSHKIGGIGYTWEDFRTGNNSGFCALQYAILKGYKEINLLGIDLTCGEKRSHFHRGYGQSISKFDDKLKEYYQYWRIALKLISIERPDIKIYSCSKISKLNDIIPHKELK